MPKYPLKYEDRHGNKYALSGLDPDERDLIDRLRARASKNPDWGEFRNFWMSEITKLYDPRGLSRRETIDTIVYQVAQDLTSRLGIAQGQMRESDYRDELERLITTRFPTKRAFCEATGISEDLLSHVLAKRKNLAIDTLTEALSKIGYTIRITPTAGSSGS